MAKMQVVSVNKRTVTVDVEWADGLSKKGIIITGVPVEDFDLARQFLADYIGGVYTQVKADAVAAAYANPVIDPRVLAAIGHAFDNDGKQVS